MRKKVDRRPSQFLTDILHIKQRVDDKLEEIHQTLTSDPTIPEEDDPNIFEEKLKETA